MYQVLAYRPMQLIMHMPAPAGTLPFLSVVLAAACSLAATSALPGLHSRALLKAARACREGAMSSENQPLARSSI